MSTVSVNHPDSLLDSLLAKRGRSNKRAHLSQLHELCRRRHQSGSREFSLPAIGRLAEEQGILKGRALYNAPSADYRALIQAWADYAGPPAPNHRSRINRLRPTSTSSASLIQPSAPRCCSLLPSVTISKRNSIP